MKIKKRWPKVVMIILSCFILILAIALFILLPKKIFREPTGPYQVGMTTRYVVDSARSETLSADPDDHRELFLQIWYPARENDLSRASYGTYMPEMIAQIAKNMELPAFLLQHLKSVRTYSALDVELSAQEPAYPVILFSHGLGLYGFQNTFQMEELASHGYIVVGIQHPYHSLLTVFPDGRTIAEKSYDMAQFDSFIEMNEFVTDIWVKDAGSILDYLERINLGGEDGRFTNRIDLKRVGMFGHSIGGAASAQALLLEPRIQAAVNLDGTLTGTGEIPGTGFTKPFMQLSAAEFDLSQAEISGSEAVIGVESGISQEEYDKHADFLQVFENNQRNAFVNGGYHIWLKGASHYTFTDIALYSPLVPYVLKDKIDTKLAHRTINAYTLAFFDKNLRQIDSPLLKPSESDIVKVTVGIGRESRN